jgi:hypothetical protein
MLTSKRFCLARSRMLGFLEELDGGEGRAVSLYLPPGMPSARVVEALDRAAAIHPVPEGINDIVTGSAMGAIAFWGAARMCLVLPPFPITEEYTADGYTVGPLCSLLSRDYMIALILVRLGSFSVGVARGTVLVGSKTGTGVVHGRHKKGGSSQARFARHREKQIETFLGRVCGHAREQIEPHARSLDYVVYGGARSTILSLRKSCPFLNQFDGRILRMILDIPDPRRAVLEKSLSDVWSTTVIEWRGADD